ncbi:MAG: DegT/DnrJ/EryC1/StrS family aminotransferase [Trueperaceae bacterium]|nr:DegT/DnrJ/EryC1/StrS family aminotransferase [Trueperaceae bacterium]
MLSVDMASADIQEEDIQAVLEVMRSGRLALGPKTLDFEQAMADYAGVKHGIAVSSGTAGLHVIVRALGIGPGDEVIVPSFTFAASANVVLYEGATPVFVDIEPDTFTLDPEDVVRKISPRTKAIMTVDVFGHPVLWDEILAIANEHGLAIIDDCCEALGSEYNGTRIGKLGDAGCFAFYPNKQITTGEGGVIVTDRDDIAEITRSLRNQGRGAMGAWLEHERLGYNYRLNELSAALGISQLARLESFIDKRERVAQLYNAALADAAEIRLPVVRDNVKISRFVYVVLLAEGLDRDPIMAQMAEAGIPTRAYFSPLHLQPYLRERFGNLRGTLPVTESVARRTIALPFHNHLTEAEVAQVTDALTDAVAQQR